MPDKPFHPADPAVADRTRGAFAGIGPQRAGRRLHRSRPQQPRGSPDDEGDVDAYSIADFCERHDISQAFFHLLRADGLGPRIMRVKRRVLISREAAADWRRERERAAAEMSAT